ncbi:MAG: HAMP domain-containing protein [Sandaracinus sp.]|nr:HAMP domain-containing protein [Sandaracinus sp.]MCB9637112.1 HAMP domain-containing protein [Sandaracinus sp.]
MRGLFLRIFVSFWLAILVIATGSYVLFELQGPSKGYERRRGFYDEVQRGEAELAFTLLRERGVEAAEARLVDLYERSGIAIHLVQDGRIVASPMEPGGLVQRAAVAELGDERVELESGRLAAVVLPLEGGARAVARRERRSPMERFLGSPSVVPFRILLIALVGGFVAYWLARYLSRPLRQLREATHRISAGDLEVRVRSQLAGATEEVSSLGDDFDRMTERIAGLLESQRRLLRDVSHELRSPLARLGVALELARKSAEPGPHLDRIEREAGRLDELIGQILALSRLESDERGREPVDLAALLETVVHDVDYEAKGSGREVTFVSAPEGSLQGRAEVLRAAIENVVRNAVRFTPEGTAVEVSASEDADGFVVRVRDHGPGVPEAELDAIFRPFYRVSTARERASGGTGVGLAITERAARMHGGSASARNAEGGGLEVRIRLARGAA